MSATAEDIWLRLRHDPIAWCVAMLPADQQPRPHQVRILEALARGDRVAAAACRGAGKTRAGAIAALWFLTTRPSLVFVCLPIWSQVESFMREARALWNMSECPRIFPSWQTFNTEIHTDDPKWRLEATTSDKAGNLEGRHGPVPGETLLIADEAKNIGTDFWLSLQGIHPQKTLATSTAGAPVGWFYNAFARDRSLWSATFQLSAKDIPELANIIDPRLYGGTSTVRYKTDVLAQFVGADEAAALPFDLIALAVERKFPNTPQFSILPTPHPCVMGVDVAGTAGRDDNVATILREGRTVLPQEVWKASSTLDTVGKIISLVHRHGPARLAIDAVGVGIGIYDAVREQLKHSGVQVIAWNGGKTARDGERYQNIKTETVLADLLGRLESANISLPQDDELLHQLAAWRTVEDARGRSRVIQSGSDSLDKADSLIIALHAQASRPAMVWKHSPLF